MSRIRAAMVAAALGAAALFLPAAPAHAGTDYGNNNYSCDYYEICFNALSNTDWDTEWGLSHTFYWGSMHHDQELLCSSNQNNTCFYLMDQAVGFWNRDSDCDVKLWDVTDYGQWYVYGDFGRGFRGDVGARRNNGHSRC